MLTSAPAVAPITPAARRALRPLHLWHLLSLDAPTVATLWTAFLARSAGLRLPLSTLLSMFLAVWTLYAADRLLDARPLLRNSLPTGLEARHLFHHRYRPGFVVVLSAVALVLALLLPRLDPRAISLDLLLGALLIGYFVVIHATASASRLPKEIAVGPFFSAACFIPTIARQPALRPTLLPAAILFAALCSLNCLTIFALEHPATGRAFAHPLTRLAAAHLPRLSLTLIAASLALSWRGASATRSPSLAIAISATLLLLLPALAARRSARSLLGDSTTLRALADLALTTPVLLLRWHL